MSSNILLVVVKNTMSAVSPLTRQTQQAFEPKINQLYTNLFTHDDLSDRTWPLDEGFWREVFLLPPNKRALHDVLKTFTAADLLQITPQTRGFILKALSAASSSISPQSENALENLTAFFVAVLSKRYITPSTDIIEILAGLDRVDQVMVSLYEVSLSIISQDTSQEIRRKAMSTVLALVCGAFQTSVAEYFMQPAFLASLLARRNTSSECAGSSLSLIGILANYNKFETRNIYLDRIRNSVDSDTQRQLLDGIVQMCINIRQEYIDIQDDVPEVWSLTSTLTSIGLRSLTSSAKKQPLPTEEEIKTRFAMLPAPTSIVLLSVNTFTESSPDFLSMLLASDELENLSLSPLSAFLSLTSYLGHHAHRNDRALHYSLLALLTLRRMLLPQTKAVIALCSTNASITIRLARQRAPYLPLISSARPPTTAIIDILTDVLSHNVRLRLSLPLYHLTLTTFHMVLTQLSTQRLQLAHHWSYVWHCLINLMRFLTTYAQEILKTHRLLDLQTKVATPLMSMIALTLLHGDNFLPDDSTYNDLFYKILEVGDTVLPKFISVYATSLPSNSALQHTVSIVTTVNEHYRSLLQSRGRPQASFGEIQSIITTGHEGFSQVVDKAIISNRDNTLHDVRISHQSSVFETTSGQHGTYGTADSDFRLEFKQILRTVTEDGMRVALQ